MAPETFTIAMSDVMVDEARGQNLLMRVRFSSPVFFAFCLTHVPPTRFANFWSIVGSALAPGGRVSFVDDCDRERADECFATPSVWRRLGDGSEHRVVKVYYTPGQLTARLAELGWSADVSETTPPLLVGTARRTSDF